MVRRARLVSILLVAVIAARPSRASSSAVETRHLTVSDATGKLSQDQLNRQANEAQALLERVLAFWSVGSGMERFGKIHVIFDVPRRDVYSSVFYWETSGGKRVRTVQVFSSGGSPQMMAHKLTSAVFPQKDKLIRNLMGILTEAHVGDPLTFPMCGFSSDDWALALVGTKRYVPLAELGPDHESWGMKDAGGGKLSILDKARQHAAYAEAGSFGAYLFQAHGVEKIKRFHRLSSEKARPSTDAFGLTMQELEARWLEALKAAGKGREEEVSVVSKLIEGNPGTACAEAQRLVTSKR